MTIASWSVNELDRLGRSVKEVLTIADELYEHRIGLRILTRHARRHVHPESNRHTPVSRNRTVKSLTTRDNGCGTHSRLSADQV